MQSKEELEKWYEKEDPWGYKNNKDDDKRKEYILKELWLYPFFNKALDLGCGEGFLTKYLPAKKIYGYDISDTALSRLPKNVIPLKRNEIIDKYDLIIATGILYKHYNYMDFINIINKYASGIVLTCNIKDWEKGINLLKNEKIHRRMEFKYKKYIEILRIFNYENISIT